MAEVDPEALADVAYGIFEHLLNGAVWHRENIFLRLSKGVLTSNRILRQSFRNFLRNTRNP